MDNKAEGIVNAFLSFVGVLFTVDCGVICYPQSGGKGRNEDLRSKSTTALCRERYSAPPFLELFVLG